MASMASSQSLSLVCLVCQIHLHEVKQEIMSVRNIITASLTLLFFSSLAENDLILVSMCTCFNDFSHAEMKTTTRLISQSTGSFYARTVKTIQRLSRFFPRLYWQNFGERIPLNLQTKVSFVLAQKQQRQQRTRRLYLDCTHNCNLSEVYLHTRSCSRTSYHTVVRTASAPRKTGSGTDSQVYLCWICFCSCSVGLLESPVAGSWSSLEWIHHQNSSPSLAPNVAARQPVAAQGWQVSDDCVDQAPTVTLDFAVH